MKRVSFSSFMLVAGLLFIYLPMLILVIYSFNESKLVTVWGGWSIKWYVGLLDNTQLMGSVARSLEIACYTAVAAVALGTLAAFVLTRISQFKGRTLFGGLVTAPLVMPEVITGLSLLLLFVAMAEESPAFVAQNAARAASFEQNQAELTARHQNDKTKTLAIPILLDISKTFLLSKCCVMG